MMNTLITVTFDGKFLKPENPLDLEINHQYQIQVISPKIEDEFDKLEQEFNWLIADLGVNQPLTRDKAYEG